MTMTERDRKKEGGDGGELHVLQYTKVSGAVSKKKQKQNLLSIYISTFDVFHSLAPHDKPLYYPLIKSTIHFPLQLLSIYD